MAKTAYRKPKKKVHVFDIVNYIVFILIGLLVLVPIWKVVVDSFNAVGVYQFRLWPEDFTLDGYKTIIHTQRLYRPFINSVITTVLGTFLGLLLSTLGGYVLIQFDMPGRNFFAYFLLFTMIFSGGMIPEYLVMKQLHLVNSMWILVVKHGMNVYNLVNFQYQLRNMIMDGDTPTTQYSVSQNTLFYAAIVCAILPFMALYPFLQKYFVKGVNIGAVKE